MTGIAVAVAVWLIIMFLSEEALSAIVLTILLIYAGFFG